MTGMKGHPGQPLDDEGDPRQGPQIGGESLVGGSSAERCGNATKLRRTQARFSPGAAGPAQATDSCLAPLLVPTADTLPADPQLAGNGRLREAPGEEAAGLLAASCEGDEVTVRFAGGLHTRSLSSRNGVVNI